MIKEGICPKCYDDLIYDGPTETTYDQRGSYVSCVCGFTGIEWYTMCFDTITDRECKEVTDAEQKTIHSKC